MTETADHKSPLFGAGGWRTAVIYFGLVSFGFTQPLLETVSTFRREFHFGPGDALLIVLVFQILPAAALIFLRRLLRGERARLALDILILTAALAILLRQAKVVHLNELDSRVLRYAIIIGAAGAALGAAFFARRFFAALIFYAGAAAPAFSLFFIYDTAARAAAVADLPPPPRSASGPPVVLVITDQLTMDAMHDGAGGGPVDAGAFPNFARLAARSVFWSNAISNYPATKFAFPSFLTSRIHTDDSGFLDENIEHTPDQSLFGVFEDAGYRIHVYSDYFGCEGRRFVCARYLDADRPGFLLKVFMHFVRQYGPGAALDRYFPSGFHRAVRTSSRHLVSTARGAQPGEFHLVHLMTTHEPYVFDAQGNYRYTPHRRFRPGVDFGAVRANYLDQARYMDKVMGRALAALDARPDGGGVIWMVTSDSGVCQSEECPEKAATPAMFHIPAMLMSPLHAPRIDRDDFQSIDLAPTLCEAAGLKNCAGHGFEGVPRLSAAPPPRPRRIFPDPRGAGVDIPLPARPVKLN